MAVLFSDNFNRGSLGANWTALLGSFVLTSNQVRAGSSDTSAIVNSVAGPASGYVEIDCTVLPTYPQFFALLYRIDGSFNGYYFGWDNGGATLYRIDGGASTTPVGATGFTGPTAGDRIRVAFLGSTHLIYYNSTLITTRTEGTYTGAGSCGMNASGTTARCDNFEFGTLDISGVLSTSIGDVTLASTATLALTGALSASIGDITLAATGKVDITGQVSADIGDITLEAAGELEFPEIEGELAADIGEVGLAAAGALEIQGELSGSIGDVALAAAGVVDITGAVSAGIGEITLVATGELPITGELSASIGEITLEATGENEADADPNVLFSDDFDRGSLGADWIDPSGLVTVDGTGLVFGAGDSIVSLLAVLCPDDGYVEIDAVAVPDSPDYGAVDYRLDGDNGNEYSFTYDSSGATLYVASGWSYSAIGADFDAPSDDTRIRVEFDGSTHRVYYDGVLQGTRTDGTHLGDGSTRAAVSGAGTSTRIDNFEIGTLPDAIEGTLSASIGDITLAAAGALEIAGTVSAGIGEITLAAAGTTDISGAVAASIGDIVLSAAGALEIQGELTADIGEVTLEAVGTTVADRTGELNASIGETTLAATGTVDIAGSLGVPIGDITLAATGTLDITGAVNASIGEITLEAHGRELQDINAVVNAPIGEILLTATGVLFIPRPIHSWVLTPAEAAKAAREQQYPLPRRRRAQFDETAEELLRRSHLEDYQRRKAEGV